MTVLNIFLTSHNTGKLYSRTARFPIHKMSWLQRYPRPLAGFRGEKVKGKEREDEDLTSLATNRRLRIQITSSNIRLAITAKAFVSSRNKSRHRNQQNGWGTITTLSEKLYVCGMLKAFLTFFFVHLWKRRAICLHAACIVHKRR